MLVQHSFFGVDDGKPNRFAMEKGLFTGEQLDFGKEKWSFYMVLYELIGTKMGQSWDVNEPTLQQTNIAMENCLFIDGLSIKNGYFSHSYADLWNVNDGTWWFNIV